MTTHADDNRAGGTKRVALVIGAGGVKCAAALGLWQVLQREDIKLDLLVGCSGGSIYAALMALGHDLATCQRLTGELWTPAITKKRDLHAILSAFLPRLFRFDGHFGMLDDAPMLRALDAGFGKQQFSDAITPLRIIATDLHSGERVTLDRGMLRDAVRASSAVPYIWKPWRIDDRWLLDGCLADPLPVDVAIREGADIILAMGFDSPMPKSLRSATRYAFQVNSIYTNNLLRANYAFHNLAHHAEIIPILPDFDRPVRLFDTDQIPYVIEQGAHATAQQIGYLRRLLGGARD